MAFYEHTFIGKQDLSNKEIDNLVDKYSKIISQSGNILKTEKWGILTLAKKLTNRTFADAVIFQKVFSSTSSLKEIIKL